jgi:hypothetical protein
LFAMAIRSNRARVRVLAVVVLVVGACISRELVDALRRSTYDELATPVVMWLTAATIVPSIGAVMLVATCF